VCHELFCLTLLGSGKLTLELHAHANDHSRSKPFVFFADAARHALG
jgi:hypothetical protein